MEWILERMLQVDVAPNYRSTIPHQSGDERSSVWVCGQFRGNFYPLHRAAFTTTKIHVVYRIFTVRHGFQTCVKLLMYIFHTVSPHYIFCDISFSSCFFSPLPAISGLPSRDQPVLTLLSFKSKPAVGCRVLCCCNGPQKLQLEKRQPKQRPR